MPVYRNDRIGEEVQKTIAEILRTEIKDPDVPMMTSVLSAQVTRDLRHATVYVSVMGDEEVQKKALKALKRSEGFVRRQLGTKMKLRYTPEVHFQLDHSIETSIRIASILEEIRPASTETTEDNTDA